MTNRLTVGWHLNVGALLLTAGIAIALYATVHFLYAAMIAIPYTHDLEGGTLYVLYSIIILAFGSIVCMSGMSCLRTGALKSDHFDWIATFIFQVWLVGFVHGLLF